jgi:hypothetical protein
VCGMIAPNLETLGAVLCNVGCRTSVLCRAHPGVISSPPPSRPLLPPSLFFLNVTSCHRYSRSLSCVCRPECQRLVLGAAAVYCDDAANGVW